MCTKNFQKKSCSNELFNERIANRILPYTLIFQKSPLEDPNTKLMNKIQNLPLKLRKMSPSYTRKLSLGSAKLFFINFIKLYFNAASVKNKFYKNQITSLKVELKENKTG